VENLHRYSAPTATLYDTVTAPLLRRFLRRVAGDLAQLAPQGRILEVGAGPAGWLPRWPSWPPASG
jgi:hypothetical protein